jgi:hypothetical protein
MDDKPLKILLIADKYGYSWLHKKKEKSAQRKTNWNEVKDRKEKYKGYHTQNEKT